MVKFRCVFCAFRRGTSLQRLEAHGRVWIWTWVGLCVIVRAYCRLRS